MTGFVSGNVRTWTLLVDAPIHTVDPPWQHQIDIAYGTGMLLLASTTCTSFVGFDVMAWFLICFAGLLLLLQDVEEEWTIRSNQELDTHRQLSVLVIARTHLDAFGVSYI